MTAAKQTVVAWERARASLSHDLLKNQIIPAAFKLSKVVGGEIEDVDYLTVFRLIFLPKIDDIIRQIEILCSTAEESLSPRQYFDDFPLSECDDETKLWLRELTHGLWLTNRRLYFYLSRLREELSELRGASNDAKQLLDRSDLQSARQAMEDLKSSLSAVADELSIVRRVLPYRP